jgi:hypothetical protein
MESCSSAAVEAMESQLASLLGLDASKVSVACRYTGSSTVFRRRGLLGRTLMQGVRGGGQG